MIKELTEKEVSYLKELRKYEGQWVAVLKAEDGNLIVGSGKDGVEARRAAQSNGFHGAVLFWVRPFNGKYILGLRS